MKHWTFIFLSFIYFSNFSQNLDYRMLERLNIHRNQQLDPLFLGVTHSIVPITVATPILMIGIGHLKKNEGLLNKSISVVESIALNGIVTLSLKYAINRRRPSEKYPEIDPQTSFNSPAFPSGHTSGAFTLATALSISFPKWYVIYPSFIWASAMGYSRMHLGVHYPSDVLVGAIIGSGTALLTHYINQKILAKKKDAKALKILD